jgi:predicted Fe-S protein YdhL (DUF1289 family)
VGAKTVTAALSAEQFAWLKAAIANQRKVWDTLQRMQQLTATYALEKLPNPAPSQTPLQKEVGP